MHLVRWAGKQITRRLRYGTSRFSAISPEFTRAPYQILEKIDEPVFWMPNLTAWVVIGNHEVREAFDHPDLGRDMKVWDLYQAPKNNSPTPTLDWARLNTPLTNKELHPKHRRLFQQSMKPAAIRRMEDQVRHIVGKYTDCFLKTGEVDLAKELVNLPADVIAFILGIDVEGGDIGLYRKHGYNFLLMAEPRATLEQRKLADQGAEFLLAFLRKMIHERRAHPREDMISDLVAVMDGGKEFHEDEIVLCILGLLVAGTHTMAQSAMLGIKTLLEHPDKLEELRADRSLLPSAVEELLRLEMPGKFVTRFATKDLMLGGKRIREGDILMLSLVMANRDPSLFEKPGEINFHRDNLGKTLTFGHGITYCTGAHIARQTLKCIYSDMLDKLPADTRLLADKMVWDDSGLVFRTIESMPVHINRQVSAR